MPIWLIDESGDEWLHGSAELESALRSKLDSAGSVDFLVSNAGFVHVSCRGALLTARYSSTIVERNALVGLMRLIAQLSPSAVSIKVLEQPEALHIFRARKRWLQFIGDAIDQRSRASYRISRKTPVSMSPFSLRCAAGFEIVTAVDDDALRDRLLDSLFQGMFTLTRLRTNELGSTFVAMGSKLKSFGSEFSASIAGRNVLDAPDAAYGAWISEHYAQVAESGVPTADDVDATISWAGDEPQLHRYSRLVVPVQRSPSERLVLSVTVRRHF